MAEYIDRTQIYYDVDCSTCNGHSNPNCDCDKCLQKFVASKNQLDNTPTADVVERAKVLDRIKEAREKMDDYNVRKKFDGCNDLFKLGVTRGLDLAVEIINKLIVEVEGK